ncbi:MAG: peptidoglycan DD-metalloendopeptidase family protein [Clostridiales bacterium]|nr:peptidoglycan DD-metalloendopeptidase family protein [Clostridiales bacterium]MBR6488808.1 peptidoglycan DD-metalloendopeptidase family protein [Clostridiales bacterium]
MRYKEELEAIAKREAYLRRKYLMPALTAVILITVLIAGTAIKSVSARAAAPDMATVKLSDVTKKDIEDAKKKRDETKKKAKSAASKVYALKNKKKNLNYELMALNDANDEQRAQYEQIASQLEAALDARVQALDDFIKAGENLEKKQEEFQKRVSVMFQFQNKSMFEVLLESNSLAGFFTNMEIMTLIADADAQAVDSMKVAVDDAKLQKELALKEATELKDIADEKQKQLDDLEALIGKTQQTLKDVKTKLTSWEKKEDQLQKESESLNDKIKKLQKQYAKQNMYKGPANGKFRWPVNWANITSPFGWRIHPVYNTKKFHSGIDIGGSYGSPIMAAGAGVVILVSKPVQGQNTGGTGYGNYCIIDHGGGYTTLYGHCRSVYVKSGQKVKAGQRIGEMGSTGTSTGAHLHFEVRKNGSPVNPERYLP